MPRQYSNEFKQKALRLVEECLPGYDSEFTAIKHVAVKLGVSAEALRRWLRQAEVDAGSRVGSPRANQPG